MMLYQQGETGAFDILYMRHHTGVYSYVMHWVKDPSVAEELLQDIFLKVIRSSKRYKPTAKFRTWLYQIARNQCIDHLRKAKHRKTVTLNPGDDNGEGNPIEERIASDSPDQEHEVYKKRIRELLKEGIGTLPQEQRDVLLLREDAELAFNDIAEILDCPVNTVKSRMRYALQHLNRFFVQQGVRPERGGDQ